MMFMYIGAFVAWAAIAIMYFSIRRQKHLVEKGRKRNAVYITGKVYLKAHDDKVIHSLYKGKKKIADDVLEYNKGFFSVTFTTIFGKIVYNKINGHFITNPQNVPRL